VTEASAGPIEVLALSPARRADRARFIAVPAPLYRGDPRYVAPLRREVHALLDPARNPWHRHAELALFVAVRGSQTVGRIAAIRDRRYDQIRAEPLGFFGFFDCVDEPACAGPLLAEAERWARARGAREMRGPVSPSMHDECGTLVEGFDSRPVIQMPYNPPYHVGLLEACGYRKAQDLLAYDFDLSQEVRPTLARIAGAVEARGEFRIRPIDPRRFASEVEMVRALYNAAWEVNWGFVPLTVDEMAWRAGQLKQLIDPRVALVVEARRGASFEPVGFALAVPDVNEILVGLRGRLTPLALFRLVRGLRRVRTMRLLLLGVIAGYRKRGLEALLIREIHVRGARAGVTRAELSWVLEDNVAMNRTIVKAGGRHYKTYRIFGRPLV
jgi:hypothetical protein